MKKLFCALLSCALAFSMPLTAFAEGYIVRTTIETVETTNGVVTGYSKETYDSPVQYGTPPATTCTTAPATTCAASTAQCSTGSTWTPNWGANYANEQAYWMDSGRKSTSSSSYCSDWKPNWNQSATSNCSGNYYATIGDAARAQAASVKSYAESYGYSVSVSCDWGDCNYRGIEIIVQNKNHKRTWVQVTELKNGYYQTHYERDGCTEYLSDVEWYIKDRRE